MKKIEIDDTYIKEINKKCNARDISITNYINELIKKDLFSIVKLNYGFYYNKATNKLYNNFDQEVNLTKMEEKLFSLLLENRNQIVSIQDIQNIVWKGKNMTRFTLRNKVKTLRDKTYYEIIKNHSNIGYEMN